MRQVADGQSLLDPAVTQRVLDRLRNGARRRRTSCGRSPSRSGAPRPVAEGLTNRQIGEQMFLAEKTVKNYVSSLLAKLGLERRTQAAVLATKLLQSP